VRLTLFSTLVLVAGVIAFSFLQANAAENNPGNDSILGPGKNSCSEFITVVDGNWSQPLNALYFHGYIAWAQGMISGHNQNSDGAPVRPNTDELKMALVDLCRDNPDIPFAEVVKQTLSEAP